MADAGRISRNLRFSTNGQDIMPTTSTAPAARVSVNDVDEAALADAQRMLGTSSPADTINEALRETARRRLAREYIEFLQAQAPANDENPTDLRAQAWR